MAVRDPCSLLCASLLVLSGCYVEPDPSANIHPPDVDTSAPAMSPAPETVEEPIDLSPPEWVAWYREGVRLLEAGEYALAVSAFDQSLEFAPKFALTYANRGFAHRNLGMYEPAIADLRKCFELDDLGAYMPRLYLAEILAVCPEDGRRDGKEAIEIATQGCEMTQWEHGPMLAVLAAAYAEDGNFDEAVHWQTEAAEHVKEELAQEMADRLELYRSGQPCRRLLPDPRGLSRGS